MRFFLKNGHFFGWISRVLGVRGSRGSQNTAIYSKSLMRPPNSNPLFFFLCCHKSSTHETLQDENIIGAPLLYQNYATFPRGGSHPGSLQDPMINFLLVGKRGNLSYLIVMTPGSLKPFFHSSLKRIYSEKRGWNKLNQSIQTFLATKRAYTLAFQFLSGLICPLCLLVLRLILFHMSFATLYPV